MAKSWSKNCQCYNRSEPIISFSDDFDICNWCRRIEYLIKLAFNRRYAK